MNEQTPAELVMLRERSTINFSSQAQHAKWGSDLVRSLVAEQRMYQQVSYIFSVYGTTHIHILCEDSPPSCRLCLQASWSNDGELHVPTYALHTLKAFAHLLLCVGSECAPKLAW